MSLRLAAIIQDSQQLGYVMEWRTCTVGHGNDFQCNVPCVIFLGLVILIGIA